MTTYDRKIEEESDILEVKSPVFIPQIPSELLVGLAPEMKHLFEEASIQTQAAKWLCEHQESINLQQRKMDGRLKRVERWKSMVSGNISIILTIIVVLSTILNIVSKFLEFAPAK